MNDLKQEGKLSLKNKGYVLACLAIALWVIVLFRIEFPTLRNELSDILFIATFLLTLIGVFRGKK